MDLIEIDRLRTYASTRKGELAELITEAADALERQTCEDAVSRQAAIDAIGTWDKFGADERGRIVRWHKGLVIYVRLRDVLTAIVNLPAVQPETHEKRTETHSCDLISRAMLLEYIHNEPVGKMLCDKYNLDGVIKQLPSVQPETHDKHTETHACDCISRQAAIELAMQYCPDDDGSCSKADRDIRELLDDLENLPSAQPEIIRCKDCRFQDKGCNESESWNLCGYRPWLHVPTEDEHYCGYAERRPMTDREKALAYFRNREAQIPMPGARAMFQEAIKALEQPEVIRCKNCKYGDTFHELDEPDMPMKCLGQHYGGTYPDDFCSYAERRDDGN